MSEEKNETAKGRVLLLTGYGGYDKLVVQSHNNPVPKANEVLLNVRACGLNFAELMGRQGLYPNLDKPPCVMGFEAAGTVIAIGGDVTKLKEGDRVACLRLGGGLWREYATVPEINCFKLPDEMSFEEGATMLINYLTAFFMLFDQGNLREGQSVLVHMAAGGVGCAAAQLCKTIPNVTVFGTASAAKHEKIREQGITHPIDYRTQDYVTEVRKVCPKGVDIVLDPLLGKDATLGYNLLKPLGRIIHFGAANMVTGERRSLLTVAKTWWQTANVKILTLTNDNKGVFGFNLATLSSEIEAIHAAMEKLIEMYKKGQIKPVIHASYPFEKVGQAMADLHERRNIGKVILIPQAETSEEIQPSEDEPKKELPTSASE